MERNKPLRFPVIPFFSTLLFGAALAMPALAQEKALDEQAVKSIVGSDISEEEATAKAKESKILSAIDKTTENTGAVRKTTEVKQVDIVFLPDATRTEGGPPRKIESKLKQHESEIKELRKEIEGNALLFHAIDSRRVLTQDVLAIEFQDAGKVVIYAAAKPSN
jgi:hypothetical protein